MPRPSARSGLGIGLHGPQVVISNVHPTYNHIDRYGISLVKDFVFDVPVPPALLATL